MNFCLHGFDLDLISLSSILSTTQGVFPLPIAFRCSVHSWADVVRVPSHYYGFSFSLPFYFRRFLRRSSRSFPFSGQFDYPSPLMRPVSDGRGSSAPSTSPPLILVSSPIVLPQGFALSFLSFLFDLTLFLRNGFGPPFLKSYSLRAYFFSLSLPPFLYFVRYTDPRCFRSPVRTEVGNLFASLPQLLPLLDEAPRDAAIPF